MADVELPGLPYHDLTLAFTGEGKRWTGDPFQEWPKVVGGIVEASGLRIGWGLLSTDPTACSAREMAWRYLAFIASSRESP